MWKPFRPHDGVNYSAMGSARAATGLEQVATVSTLPTPYSRPAADEREAGPVGPHVEANPTSEADADRDDIVLRIEAVEKRFGDVRAVNGLSLEVKRGEIFTLLGPSGCGKTTSLRQVAGLESVDGGRIVFRDHLLADAATGFSVPPHRRGIGMVFQSYAIWPHLSVFENVAYPLRVRKEPRAQIDVRVRELLETVGLTGLDRRSGTDLSGGQQQRVALARALAHGSELLLLDEPFSNLDVQLREQMRTELRVLQRKLGVTVILVTHDQTEALTLSDRIAIMRAGRVEQVGSPRDVYDAPATPFVRDFVGSSITLPATMRAAGPGGIEATVRGSAHVLHSKARAVAGHSAEALASAAEVTFAIRPEAIRLRTRTESGAPGVPNQLAGIVEAAFFTGERMHYRVRLVGDVPVPISAYGPKASPFREGDPVAVCLPAEDLSVWLS